MPTVEQQIARLATVAPVRPRPVGQIVARAQQRRRRRRQRLGVGVLIALGAVVAGAVVIGDGDQPSRVKTGQHNARSARVLADASRAPVSRRPDKPPMTAPPQGNGLTLVPASELADGAAVTLRFDPDPGTEVQVAQCAAEVVEFLGVRDADNPLRWCGRLSARRGPNGDARLRLFVSRSLEIPRGTVDCAESVARCVVIARFGRGSDLDERFAPLSFHTGLAGGSQPEAGAEGVDGAIYDSQPVRVVGRGFAPDEDVVVRQCIGTLLDVGSAECDQARGRPARADRRGRLDVDVLLFHDVFTSANGRGRSGVAWRTCEPCALVLQGSQVQIGMAALEVAPAGRPLRPRVSIAQPGPYRPGQRVTLEGSGFQSGGGGVRIGWCAATGPRTREVGCQYPGGAAAVPYTEGLGVFELKGFALPKASTTVEGARCASKVGACVLGWLPAGSSRYAFATPLDLSD